MSYSEQLNALIKGFESIHWALTHPKLVAAQEAKLNWSETHSDAEMVTLELADLYNQNIALKKNLEIVADHRDELVETTADLKKTVERLNTELVKMQRRQAEARELLES